MSEKKLLTCPLCGEEAELKKEPIGKGEFLHWVSCSDESCASMGRLHTTEQGAIEQWNTRKPMEKIVERLEEKAKEYTNDDLSRRIPWFGIDEAIEIVKEEGGLND